MKKFVILLLISIWATVAIGNSDSFSVNYPMLNYTPLSDEAKSNGQLDHYEDVETSEQYLKIDNLKLKFSVPKNARAYDVIPVKYELEVPDYYVNYSAIEAVAFEDSSKIKDNSYYSLNIPGNLNVKLEYLGSIGATYKHDEYVPLTTDPNTAISPFPPFERDEFVKSSIIKEADVVWFKIRLTNTGDTILDPEGFSGSFLEPFIYKLSDDGKILCQGQPVNLFIRHLEYLYPGDSTEMWVNFKINELGDKALGLDSGKYKISFRMVARFYEKYNWMANIWAGSEFARLEVPITVTKEGGEKEVEPVFVQGTRHSYQFPGYWGKYEEFMSSFTIYPPTGPAETITDTIYVQVAPWTDNIRVKLLVEKEGRMVSAAVPISVSDETLQVTYNPDNIMVTEVEGKEVPVFISQVMPAMRASFHLSPFTEKFMYDFLKEQKELGVNTIANTAGGWWHYELNGRNKVELHSTSYKYFYDVLMRKLNMKCLGWAVYPPTSMHLYTIGEKLLDKEFDLQTVNSGYTSGSNTVKTVDFADPAVPEVLAAWINYQYARWGDYWYKTKDGRIPVDIEDTWGWLRDDINIRYGLGELSLKKFHQWLKDRYNSIKEINKAWDSDYERISDINPMEGQQMFHSGYLFDDSSKVFHDWSPAMEDYDKFRTFLKLEVYKKTNEILQKTIPGAELALRTEGANLIAPGDPDSENMHMRHVYYSSRRNASVFDVIKEMDVLHFYSDYTTMPYTISEWQKMNEQMVEAGVIPMFLPQFDHMRDILLNPYYGKDYKVHYNLDESQNGIMVHTLRAAYPWWKATYEAGGAPGIIWSDYLCDGFATETQKKELELLTNNFRKMMDSSASQKTSD
jgi:hypothetical protein